jgi:Protein of Unknown function (DUF2784)
MEYRILADLLAVVHAAFVAFVVAGGLLVLRRPWIAAIHLPAAAWGALVEFTGWICPLTPWENALRARAGEAGYAGGFIEHHLVPLLYPAGLTASVQIALGMAVIVLNLAIYGLVWHRHRRGGRRRWR